MKNLNAVKFNFLCPKSEVKNIVILSLDHDVSISYPQLHGAPEVVKIKGVCSMGGFEYFLDDIASKIDSFIERLTFIQGVKFKLVELEQNPAEIPVGATKEEIKKPVKK